MNTTQISNAEPTSDLNAADPAPLFDLAQKKILIVLHGAIGDVVRALPLVMRLKRRVPTARISWAIEPKSQDILIGHPAIEELIVFERGGGFSAFRRFLSELRSRKFDIALDLQRHLKSGVTCRATGAPTRIGFHPRNTKEGNWVFQNKYIAYAPNTLSKLEHYQLFGDRLLGVRTEAEQKARYQFGLEGSNELWRSTEAVIESACAEQGLTAVPPPNQRLTMIIGSSWESRNWSSERYSQLVREVYQEFGMTSVLVGGNTESRAASQIVSSTQQIPVVNLVGRTSLRQLTVLFQQTRVAIGSDSGPAHIAAAVGCPVISLWGSTSPRRSAPYGSEELVLQSSIGCSPCYRRKCPGLETYCMADIPSQAVQTRLRRLLASTAT